MNVLYSFTLLNKLCKADCLLATGLSFMLYDICLSYTDKLLLLSVLSPPLPLLDGTPDSGSGGGKC